MSENLVIILVGALLLVTLIFAGVILYLFNKLLQERKEPTQEQSLTEKFKHLKAASEEGPTSYCKNHPQDHAHGMCAICQDMYCEDCIKEHDGHTFCGPHFRLFVSHEWSELESIKTTPSTPETAFPIYDFKKELWKEEQLPAVISTHYKINIDDDSIESYVKLLVRTEELEDLKSRYSKFNQ